MQVQKIGIVGTGQMGRGIAQVAATSGYKVLIYDVGPAQRQAAVEFIKKQLDRGIEKNKWTKEHAMQSFNNISMLETMEEFNDCEMVIEAVPEIAKLKFDIFKKLDEICKKEALLLSNTSSISITEIAAQTNRPTQVAGMHFMNPVPVMKLIEGISGLETSEKTFSVVEEVAKKMGKTFVHVKDFPGFAVNRILMPMINEAVYTLYEGIASVEDIDQSMKLGTNVPMGPLQLADFIGLDTCLSIMEVLYNGFNDSKYRPCALLKQYVVSGRLGKKSGRGFYEY